MFFPKILISFESCVFQRLKKVCHRIKFLLFLFIDFFTIDLFGGEGGGKKFSENSYPM